MIHQNAGVAFPVRVLQSFELPGFARTQALCPRSLFLRCNCLTGNSGFAKKEVTG